MGASTFSVYGTGERLEDAFDEAYRQCGWEDGHSYSGTLSSKHGVTAIQRRPLPQRAAERLADDLIRAEDPRISDKWGPAGAIPVCDESALTTRTIRATATSSAEYPQEAAEALVASVTLRPGEQVVSVDVEDLPPRRYRVAVRSTEGPAVTRYRILAQGRVVGDDYPTQAAARTAMTEWLQSGAGYATEASVEAVRRRASGEPLVAATREPIARRVRGRVVVATVAADARPVGWLMFGWAPS